MGSFIELNDTLQITREQGFPEELDLEKHLKKPFCAKDFKGKEFSFRDKKDIRVYQQPPVRNLLVENRDGEWIYWGLVMITEIKHDYEKKVTSGKFKIVQIYKPDEMEKMKKSIEVKYEAMKGGK